MNDELPISRKLILKTVLSETVEVTKIDFTRLLYALYTEMDGLIRQADQKAQIILGINAFVFASFSGIFQNAGVPFFDAGITNKNIANALVIATMVIQLVSIFYALLTTAPQLGKVSGKNLFYFNDVAMHTRANYTTAFLDQSLEAIKEAVIGQIHAKSGIVRRKFQRMRISIIFLFVALVTWGISRLLVAIR